MKTIEDAVRVTSPWRSLAERRGAASPAGELPGHVAFEVPASGVSRRRFLGLLGATAALAGATSCSRPGGEEAVVPYTRRPEEITPGIANFYASAYQEAQRAYGVLVKTREGRPIHLEGNDLHPLARGKVNARTQAQVLSLYDPDRLRQPLRDGSPVSWDDALDQVLRGLQEVRQAGRGILLLTGAIVSPSRRALIAELAQALPTLRHAAWEPATFRPGITAAQDCFGAALVPRIHPGKAQVILSLGKDFLGTEDEGGASIREFADARRVRDAHDAMARLYVAEGRMSLTGSNADHRLPLRPSRAAALAFAVAREVHDAFDVPLPPGIEAAALEPFDLDRLASEEGLNPGVVRSLAADLAAAGRAALVLAGDEVPSAAHVACHLLNAMLGAEGSTIDSTLARTAPELASGEEMTELAREMASGSIAAAIFWDVNPLYALPDAAAWQEAFTQVPLRVGLSLMEDETTRACPLVLPVHHWLEAWGDHQPTPELVALQQPVIEPLFDTRQGEDVLLAWLAGLDGTSPPASFRDFIRQRWQRELYPTGSPVGFDAFWNATLHDGFLRREPEAQPVPPLPPEAVAAAARTAAAGGDSAPELVLHPDVRIWDGRHANNGWLQELPDPVNKIVWGNALCLSPPDARDLGINDGDEVEVDAAGRKARLAALVQPGQAAGVVSAALGYGRRAGSVATAVGVDVYPLLDPASATPHLVPGVKIARTGGRLPLVRTQEHHRVEGRDIARAQTLKSYAAHELEHPHHLDASLYPEQEFPGPKWGMVIDLNACVGCSGCVVACQSENNIPVVGPEQVAKGREMQWIRLDRYYEGAPENPAVVHQPMLCQHCDNAPCENVCPVNATTHSLEGLNQMAYNRCVGTRYCANNCPFKVRRFNFFDFHEALRAPAELVFNPEVSVRPRGVMEKCSFCVQRIVDAKQRAKRDGRPLADGEIRPACAAACPAAAIVFGDLKDPESRVAKLWQNDRGYRVLQVELGVSPAITYLAKLRNPSGEGESHES